MALPAIVSGRCNMLDDRDIGDLLRLWNVWPHVVALFAIDTANVIAVSEDRFEIVL